MTEENKLFPGRPNYTGPKVGIFSVVHHGELFEYSHDITERLDYIDREKPKNQIATRRHNIMYLGDCPALAECVKAGAEYAKAWDEYARAWAEYAKARAEYAKALAECVKARDEYVKAGDECDKAWVEHLGAGAAVDSSAVLAYIKQHIPDFPWNGGELVFPSSADGVWL